MQNHASTLAAEFKLDAARVAATVALIDEGNTIPFIARSVSYTHLTLPTT